MDMNGREENEHRSTHVVAREIQINIPQCVLHPRFDQYATMNIEIPEHTASIQKDKTYHDPYASIVYNAIFKKWYRQT